MISKQELRSEARKRKVSLDLIEKDYVLGWVLCAISLSGISSKVAFKGGTALSKVYFPATGDCPKISTSQCLKITRSRILQRNEFLTYH